MQSYHHTARINQLVAWSLAAWSRSRARSRFIKVPFLTAPYIYNMYIPHRYSTRAFIYLGNNWQINLVCIETIDHSAAAASSSTISVSQLNVKSKAINNGRRYSINAIYVIKIGFVCAIAHMIWARLKFATKLSKWFIMFNFMYIHLWLCTVKWWLTKLKRCISILNLTL